MKRHVQDLEQRKLEEAKRSVVNFSYTGGEQTFTAKFPGLNLIALDCQSLNQTWQPG